MSIVSHAQNKNWDTNYDKTYPKKAKAAAPASAPPPDPVRESICLWLEREASRHLAGGAMMLDVHTLVRAIRDREDEK